MPSSGGRAKRPAQEDELNAHQQRNGKKMWSVYTMGYSSVRKQDETGLSVEMWMDLESVTPSEVREEQILSINAYTWNLEKRYR